MSNTFDPYHTWLGIAPSEQPPNHYRLLGIALFEESRDVISNAADRQMAHIRTFQGGKHAAESQKLLNELSAARVTLLDPKKRAEYDAKLRATLYPPAPVSRPPYQMGQQMPPQQMPPQQMGMGGVPVPPPAPPARPMPPAPPTPPPAPPIVGTSSPKYSSKKHSHSNDDSTKLYIVIGVIAVAIIALVMMISKGSKKDPEIAQTPAATPKEDDFDTINPEDVISLGEDEFPDRPVQEHILDDPTPSTPKPTKEKPATETSVAEEKTAKTSPKADAESGADVKEVSNETAENPATEDAAGDADAAASEDAENTGKTEEAAEEETGSKQKKTSSKPKEEEKTEPGIPDDEIRKLGTGISLWMEPKREKMLKFYGASDQVQSEIVQAVEWLNDKMIRNSKRGINYWSFDHSLAKKGAGYKKVQNAGLAKQNLISATSLSLMAIFGSGQIDPKEKQNYVKAINFLYMNAKPVSDEKVLPANYEHAKKLEASLVVGETESAAFHPHAWGTTAVCNYIAYAHEMKDRKEKFLEQYEEFARALVRHIVRQQNPDGGFPAVERGLTEQYIIKSRSLCLDPTSSVISTVWNLIALQSAKAAEIPVPKDAIEKANTYLARTIAKVKAAHKDFVDLTKMEIREIRTALWGIQIFGDDFPTYAQSVYLLEQILTEYEESQLQENFMCTMFARDLRGDSWKNWREKVLGPYLKAQSTNKLEKGSWYFAGEVVNDEGGRLYCTAMTALILESFYRNAPTRPLDEWSTEALPAVEVPTPASATAPATTPAATATAPAATTPAATPKEEEPQESFLGEGQELELSTGDDDDDDDDDE